MADTLSNIFKAERIKRGLTQWEMAEILGVATITYQRYERGKIKFIMNARLEKISKVLGMSFEELRKLSINPSIKDFTGKRYGRLTLTKYIKSDKYTTVWSCKCDCGKIVEVGINNLMNGNIQSCGCLRTETVKNEMKKNLLDGTNMSKIRSEKPYKSNKTGCRGVKQLEEDTWTATISVKGKKVHLGTFHVLRDAIAARKEAERKYYEPIIKANEKKINF